MSLESYSKNSIIIDGKVYYTGQSDGSYRSMEAHKRKNTTRMFVNGKYIPKTHPLHKPGRYKTLDDAWSHTEIDSRSKEGEVYIISNAAWPGWYKVGKAVSSEDRLSGYQTSSPFRDYDLVYFKAFDDRHTSERVVHNKLRKVLDEDSYNGEWFSASLDAIIDIIEGVKYEEANAGHRDEPSPQYDLDLCNAGR